MLPAYPHFEPVHIEHHDEAGRLLTEAQPETSELTFTNIYMWRHHYRFRLCELSGCLVVLGQLPGRAPFFLPPAGREAPGVCRALLADPAAPARAIGRVPESYLEGCGLRGEEWLSVVEEAGQADYVYLTADLVGLAGRRFAGKRNHLKRFRTGYRWEYQPLGADTLPGCLKLAELWCERRVCPREVGLEAERAAIWEALEGFGRLAYSGGVILVDGVVQAFTLGERLSKECAVIHIEKASPEFEGIYQAINQQLLEHELAAFRFVNREQDLNDAGLRRAKLSYHPHHLVAKFRVRAAK